MINMEWGRPAPDWIMRGGFEDACGARQTRSEAEIALRQLTEFFRIAVWFFETGLTGM
jgi:hypothetical protein